MNLGTTAPASTIQRQFWLVQKLVPATTAYHVPCLFRITGTLDERALRGAFEDLARLHPALRTTFEQRGGELVQVVHPELPLDYAYTDLTEPLSFEHPTVTSALREPFHLDAGPLFRVRLFAASDGSHLLVWTLHHIIVDLESKGILATDLAKCFSARLHKPSGSDTGADEGTARPYTEFASFEKTWLESPEAERCRKYFADHLGRAFEPLVLPEDHKRPLSQPHRGNVHRFELPPSLTEQVARYCDRTAKKPFLVLLTAWAITLARYGNTDGVTLGVPFPNRRRLEQQGTVGAFVNNLPLRVDISKEAPFSEILGQIRATMLGHHRHQELGLEAIVAALRPPRDPSRNPLFQAGFTFEPPMQVELEGLDVAAEKGHAGGTQLDVFLTLWPDHGGYQAQLEYATELFSPDSVERLAKNYLTLLESALNADHADTVAARKLALLHATERDLVVQSFNATDVTYPGPVLLHEIFLDRAAQCGDRTAVRFRDRRLTYEALKQKAAGVAGLLRKAGVRPGQHVGISMERSLEMVVAIYGTLFAGAVYVPLDPDYPESRISNMLEDANPVLVLTHAPISERWTSMGRPHLVIDVDTLPIDDTPPVTDAVPRDALYTLFTSGSTGRPKGATNTHRGVRNRILWMQEALQLTENDVVLQKTPFSFDVSTWEFFWPLFVGATLEIAPPAVHRDPLALCRLIQERKVTCLHFVPSMLGAFLEHPESANCRSLRLVVASGEALNTPLVERFARAFSARLINLYGPTEAAVDVSIWDATSDVTRSPVPIGKPIANTQLYVLDPEGAPVPLGVPGELYIGGVQVALGYVNRPELTCERFVPDPFSGHPEATLYRTGDLVRHCSDGNILFLGRLDHQVKLRGQRIELGEIEAALERINGIRKAAVIVHPPGALDARLFAYVAVASGEGNDVLTDSNLRRELAVQLPIYMVPDRFIRLPELPLSPNGKVDRKALPAPEDEQKTEEPRIAPRSEVEQWLYSQATELIGNAGLGIFDNLFESGLTSIMVAQLVGRIHRKYGVEVPLVRLFEAATISNLSTVLSEVLVGRGDAATTGLENVRSRADLRRAAAQRARRPRED
jgi:amino acid adenylation domain-containing protein